jgi:protein SCO1/2
MTRARLDPIAAKRLTVLFLAALLLTALLLSATPPTRPAAASEKEKKEAAQAGHHQHVTEPAQEPNAASGRSIYLLDSVWLNADGQRVPLASLRGRPVVAAMFYTTCTYVCPLIVDEMKRIEAKLEPALRGQVRFVLWSFDPERDSPQALALYRQKRELDPASWVLLTSDEDSVQELAAVLGVRYRKQADGEFSHSVLLHVLDSAGALVYQQAGLNKEPRPLLAALSGHAK